jgi:FkbH-like protein
MPLDDRAIAITATFTAEAIQPGLAFWAAELGFGCEIRFAGYNQVFQELLDPAGLFARNRGGFNVALVRFEDWRAAGVEDEARRLVDALHSATHFSSPMIVALCPPVHSAAEAIVRAGIADLPSVHLVACEDLSRYPVSQIEDPHANVLGHLPYTAEFFAALATAVARKINAITNPGYKVIALDCDDTLWAGICGEDGPQGVALDPPRRALQEFMAARQREGMLLALCSKNNEEDVVETFAAHPEMPLRLDDFAARRVNWESKVANLATLTDELGLGLDSFILVDDNPKECTEAEAGAPDVLALPLPADPDDIPGFLEHVWAFDRSHVTQEDRDRARMYQQNAERVRAERSSGNLEEFLAGLKLEVSISPMRPDQVARVAQLTQRTNQMNATLVRRSEAGIQALTDYEVLVVEVRDRFGSYGLTGVIIFRCAVETLVVDTFLLSCRVLGRGVEHRMVARLGEIALERGLTRVEIPFVAGQRNRPAELFLQSIGALGGITADAAANVGQAGSLRAEWHSAPGRVDNPLKATSLPHNINYLKIATELRTPSAVLERIHAASRKPARAVSEPPRTELEQDLAKLWAGLLNIPAVGIRDNFFELGGHSLLAVQLLSRVRQVYGIELSLEVVYSGEFTVAELAKAIELKEIEQAGGDYQELLQELEGLSDDEVRALLAAEQDAQ